jgi:polyhydroxybutyrate depolymerase
MHRRLAPLLVVTLLAACAPAHDEGRPTNAPDQVACTPPRIAPDAPRTRRSGGEERRYLLSVPDGETPAGGFPLVISLHGHGSTATDHEANTSLAAQARARGLVVATPDALGDPARWNFDRRPDGPDDYAFVAGLIDDLAREACIDPGRVHLAGSSNGAAFAGLLACRGDADIAAVAMVIATVPPTCPPGRHPSMLTIRGTADATVPYAGTEDMAAAWADHDGCPTPPRTDEASPGVTRTTYDACTDDRQVTLVAVSGGVHAWPGSVRADRPGNSAAAIGFSATDEVLSFFADVGQAP